LSFVLAQQQRPEVWIQGPCRQRGARRDVALQISSPIDAPAPSRAIPCRITSSRSEAALRSRGWRWHSRSA